MPRPGRPTTERAKNFKGTLRQLIRTMSHYKLPLTAAMLFAVLSTIFNIAGPKVLAKATTALATGWIARLRGTGSIDFVYIGRILLFLLGMYLLSSAFSFIQGWLMTGLSQKACYDFRRQISEKINRLPLAYFEKRTVGEVLSRITNDVDTLGQSLNQSITQLITSVTTMIGVLVMMLSISPRMTLIALLILPVSLALVLVVVKFSQKYFKAQQATLGVVNGQVEEVYAGHNVVKAFNREAVVLADFNAANDKLYESAWKSQFLSGLMMPIMNFVGNLGYVAVAIVGSIFAANGVITIGDIQAFIQYVKNFTQPIQQLSQVSNMLQSMAAAAERVFEFLNEPEEEQLISRLFAEEYGSEFVFVTHYPSKKRPFYAADDPEDPRYTLSFDLLFRGLEVTTGGQRIHDYDAQVAKLIKKGRNPEDFAGYLMSHKYGTCPHGGLGLGLERLTARLLGENNVRETCLFPRDQQRIEP